MVRFKFTKSNGTGTLMFYGDLTAQPADEIMETLLVSLDNSEHLMVSLEGVTNLDRLFMTQIDVINKIAESLEKSISVIESGPGLYEGRACI